MIDVVGAILLNNSGEILIARRKQGISMGGFWEFPGGKVEKGEQPEDSLKRELLEEMNIEIEVIKHFASNIHSYETKTINLITFTARIIKGEITLTDHDKYEWVKPSNLKDFTFAPADVPIVEKCGMRTFQDY